MNAPPNNRCMPAAERSSAGLRRGHMVEFGLCRIELSSFNYHHEQ